MNFNLFRRKGPYKNSPPGKMKIQKNISADR